MTITYQGDTFKVKRNVSELPNLNAMDSLSARMWIMRNTYPRGYHKEIVRLPAVELIAR